MGTRERDFRPRPRTAPAAIGALTAATLLLAGCSAAGGAGGRSPDARTAGVATAPAGPTLLASQDPHELALASSRTWFGQAAYAVVADPRDQAAVARAASIAAAAGVPALLAEGDGTAPVADSPVDAELTRLGAGAVLTVGTVDIADFADALAVVPAPTGAGELGRVLGLKVDQVDPDAKAPVQQLATLGPTEVLAAPADAPAPAKGRGELPKVQATTRAEGAAAVSDGSPAQAAAVGTARAAGATAVVSHGHVGATSEAVAELKGKTSVVGLGTGFGDDASFTWQAQAAETGVELPGGGQQVFDGKRYVALYGSPITPALGLLGEQGTPATIARAEQMAAPYRPLTKDRVVPALEIIVTVASGDAGSDGNYSTETDPAAIMPLVEAARQAGQYVVLDFQPGRTDFLTQVKQYEQLLRQPHVGVALDPEWRLRPDQKHLTQIGSVGVDEVNKVSAYLAGFVTENRLPQKLLVLHQFQTRMITDRSRLDTGHPQVAVLVHADGQGGQGAKQGTWAALHNSAPAGIHWGWKNFIDEDKPMLTPEQTYRQVTPVPDFVSYQ
ncbi:hypothetical protein GA0111570_10168 [Raineyella antarctica]|uniref:Lipoprotein n=1 Tax=Raineyella antarctica TaxID=1577474 RepID=A0A1G6GD12_9ACTN|nr:hypothetical protein [Raineyella antarctica]SDB79799.1 hypothetical protein GA0111570_10168 [Raineyella antarctica]